MGERVGGDLSIQLGNAGVSQSKSKREGKDVQREQKAIDTTTRRENTISHDPRRNSIRIEDISLVRSGCIPRREERKISDVFDKFTHVTWTADRRKRCFGVPEVCKQGESDRRKKKTGETYRYVSEILIHILRGCARSTTH